MLEDVANLGLGDVGAARDIGGAAELHGRVGDDPFEAVVGEQADMVARLDASAMRPVARSRAARVKLAVAREGERAAFLSRGEGRYVAEALGRVAEEFREISGANTVGHARYFCGGRGGKPDSRKVMRAFVRS